MLEIKTLELAEAQRAINAVIETAKKANHRGIAVVIVDKSGEIIASGRMDGMAPRFGKAAHRKAYTGAIFERDTSGLIQFWKGQEERGHRGPPDWNDSMLTTLPGGFVAVHGDDVVGGVGVAGGNGQISDEEFAEIALKALGEGFRHREGWN